MKNTVFVILGLLVASALFYWLEIRPIVIKKECHGWAGNQSGFDRVDGKNYWDKEDEKEVYNSLYSKCIREKGL